MLRQARISMALALTASAMALAACGGDDGTIPPEAGEEMLSRLDTIEARVAADDCVSAQTELSQLDGAIFSLPKSVGTETKESLRRLLENLVTLVDEECEALDQDTVQPPDSGATGAAGFEEDD